MWFAHPWSARLRTSPSLPSKRPVCSSFSGLPRAIRTWPRQPRTTARSSLWTSRRSLWGCAPWLAWRSIFSRPDPIQRCQRCLGHLAPGRLVSDLQPARPTTATPLADDQAALTTEVRLWRCFSEQQCCAHIGVAPPLAVTLGHERDLMNLPGLKREAACLIAPRHRIEDVQASVVAAIEHAGFVAPGGVEHGDAETEPAHLVLRIAVHNIDAGHRRERRRLAGINRRLRRHGARIQRWHERSGFLQRLRFQFRLDRGHRCARGPDWRWAFLKGEQKDFACGRACHKALMLRFLRLEGEDRLTIPAEKPDQTVLKRPPRRGVQDRQRTPATGGEAQPAGRTH